MPTTAPHVLDIARSQLGYREPGSGDGPGTQRTKYGDWYAAWSGQSAFRDTYWCAMFVSWVLATAGFAPKEAGRYGNCNPWIAWFKARGRWGHTPRVGAVVFFSWNGDARAEHVGLVESIRPDGRIVTIEGNATTSGSRDGVKRLVRRGAIVGYGYPPYSGGAVIALARPTGTRPGYPTLFRGTGGPEDSSGTQRWWVGQWYRAMARHSPGYFRRINGDPRGAVEVKRLEIGDVTLGITRKMAAQVLGSKLQWRGAIDQHIWAIYPKVR